MFFISADDFFTKAGSLTRPTREEEKALARKMAVGDQAAREALIRGYLPYVAAYIRRSPRSLHTLNTVYTCISALEKAVDQFDFLQDREPFSHQLSRWLRQCITKCIANR